MSDVLSSPIDFLSSKHTIANPGGLDGDAQAFEQTRISIAYHDLAGNVSEPVAAIYGSPQERYQAHVEIYRDDPRKLEIALGLGGYGLIMMTEGNLSSMTRPDQAMYGAGLISFAALLHGRARVLKTDGSEGVPGIISRYGIDIDQPWAQTYSVQLTDMRERLLDSGVYAAATRVLQHESVSEQTRLTRLTHNPENVQVRLVAPDSRSPRAGKLIMAKATGNTGSSSTAA